MTQAIETQPPVSEQPRPDLTGRDRMAWNILVSWGGQMVFLAAGFVLPRVIDARIGRAALGVWDFGWSLLAYFGLLQAGVTASVNRYVGKFRVIGDHAAVNCAVSSVLCIHLAVAVVVVLLGFVVGLGIPVWMEGRLGGYASQAGPLVQLLAASLAVQMATGSFGGLTTGCHRWDLHNAILAGGHAMVVAGMIAVLFSGGGLVAMAAVNLAGEILKAVARVIVAYRVFPALQLGLRHVKLRAMRNMLTFGGKTLIPRVSEILTNQMTATLLALYLGPAALALYMRPMGLVRHARTFMTKFSMVLVPSTSALQAQGQNDRLRDLLIKGTRYGLLMALPVTIGIVVLGGQLLRVWMGPEYSTALLAAMLALGHLAFISHIPAMDMIAGMKAHGRPALVNLDAGIMTPLLVLLALGVLKTGLVGAAVSATVPMTIVYGLYIPTYACRTFDTSIDGYLRG
ncbi:MAG: oligosaccharide flippase family protein, partial [Planctomycetes bacterium]|nr:oligosaccharide flippase family protein [Planctomycetota bacterium]